MSITEEELQQKISSDNEIINIKEHIYDLLQKQHTNSKCCQQIEDTKQQIESLKELISDITNQYTFIYQRKNKYD